MYALCFSLLVLLLSKNVCPISSRDFVDCDSAFMDNVDPLVLLRAHSIRCISSFINFLKNWSLYKDLEAVSYRSNSIFASFSFKEIQYVFDKCCTLGPFVAAEELIDWVLDTSWSI